MSGEDSSQRIIRRLTVVPVVEVYGYIRLMARKRHCPAGKWTYVIKNFGTAMPRTFEVTMDGEASGVYEEKPYFWIFGQTPRTGQLSPQMTFRRKWINGIYRVRFKPDKDVTARIR